MSDEGFGVDWDWYAVDASGYVGSFTTAGMRRLPVSVRQNRELLREGIRYFTDTLREKTEPIVRAHLAQYVGVWESDEQRSRYLKSFVAAARRGLYTYDTELKYGEDAQYFQVTAPREPLHSDELPENFRRIVVEAKKISFESDLVIPARIAECW